MAATPGLPLRGLRVVELGTVIAAPFACSLLAEFGAEVIKVERAEGDPLRSMGPQPKGVPLWWGVASRNKRVAALDLKDPGDRACFEALVDAADVLVENNRPGVMDRLGLGWAALSARNPRLVMLSISGFGATGPYAPRPGFGKIAEAMSGAVMLTGAPDATPLHVGFSLADATAGLGGVFGVALALYLRDAAGSGRGAHIDLGLYEPLLRMADCQLALHEAHGAPPLRRGTNDPYGWGAGDADREVRCVAGTDGAPLAVLLDAAARAQLAAAGGLDVALAGLDRPAALARLRALDVQAAPVHDGSSLAATPYFVARGDHVAAPHPVLGPLVVPGVVPHGYEGGGLRAFQAPPIATDRGPTWDDPAPRAAAHEEGTPP